MKAKTYCSIIISLCFLAITISPVYSASTLPNEAVFSWVEYKFADLFPKAQTVKSELTYEGVNYDLRSWSGAWGTRYLGITDDGEVVGFGDYTDGVLKSFGYIDDWEDAVNADKSEIVALGNKITLPDSSTYRMPMDNTKTSINLIIPLNINDDVWQDFLVVYNEFAWPQGIVLTGEPPNAIVAYISNGDGTYRVGNSEVFGTDLPRLGGIVIDYANGDMNGDGIDDYAFVNCWEDGRYNAVWSTMYTQNTIVLSEGNGQYSIHRVGLPCWTFKTNAIKNSFGTVDFHFSGTADSVEAGYQTIRYVAGQFVDVSSEYGVANDVDMMLIVPSEGETTQFVTRYGDYQTGETGFALYSKVNGVWELTDTVLWSNGFMIEFISWSQTQGRMWVTSVNGVNYGGVVLHHISPNVEYDEMTRRYTFYASMITNLYDYGDRIDEFVDDSNYLYDEGNYVAAFKLINFSVDGETLILNGDNIYNEYAYDVSETTFDYKDLNNDGYSDLLVSVYTKPWEGAHVDLGGLPAVYINNSNDEFDRIDISTYPKHSDSEFEVAGQASLKGFMSDVNGDGIQDLIEYTVNNYGEEEIIEINLLSVPIY